MVPQRESKGSLSLTSQKLEYADSARSHVSHLWRAVHSGANNGAHAQQDYSQRAAPQSRVKGQRQWALIRESPKGPEQASRQPECRCSRLFLRTR